MRTAILIALAAAVCSAQSGGSLFDGKTLEGWRVAAKPADADKGFWKVQDGAITCDSRGRKDHDYVWLIRDGEYGDFELNLKVRGYRESPGNSGVQVRSRYDYDAFWMNGPQIDVHPPTPWRTGLIYDETREIRRWIFPSLPDWKIDPSQGPKRWEWNYDGWNDLQIVCRGTNIATKLNGIPMAEFQGRGILDDDAHRKHNVGLKGHLAFQLHAGDDLLIQYKDIGIKLFE
jgi:hypothetical protein